MMPYRRCDRGGCYVEMLHRQFDVSTSSRHAGDSAMVKIVADDGKNYDLKVSLNGFSAAHDSMAELAKQKAKAAAGCSTAPRPPNNGAIIE